MDKVLQAIMAAMAGVGVVVFVALALVALSCLPTMMLVNYLFTPEALFVVFGVNKIGLWQAVCLLFLCQILFTRTSGSSNSDKRKGDR